MSALCAPVFPAVAPGSVSSVLFRLPVGPAPLADLPAGDRRRAQGIQHAPTRATFVWGRKILRLWLGQHLGVTADDLPIQVLDGRPFVAGDPVHFNLSHSDDHVMIAMTPHQPVGVDIERAGTVNDPLPLSRMVMSKRETAVLSRLSGPARQRAFLRLWVRREAYLKFRQTGFAGNDQALSCLGPAVHVARLEGQTTDHHWCITTQPKTRIAPPVRLSLTKEVP